MNLKRKGWFGRYIRFRHDKPLPERLPSLGIKILEEVAVHNESDQAIYYFLEPTGILYGAPLRYPFPEADYPSERYYDRHDRALMTQLDAIMACLVAERHYLIEGIEEETDPLDAAADIVQEYYLNLPVQPDLKQRVIRKLSALKFRRQTDQQRFETAFRHRGVVAGNLFALRAPLANVFLFLDLYHCLLWQRKRLMEGAEGPDALNELYAEQMVQREALLKLIIATAYADRKMDSRDRNLVQRLLRASQLPAGKIGELQALADGGIALEEVEFPKMPWLIRRYFLGLAVMTTLLDRSVSDTEYALLARAVVRLELWRDELDQSRAAFESFLLSHGETLRWDKKMPHLFNLADDLRERVSIGLRRNLERIVNEVRETKELYELLMKSRNETLTPEEKRKVRDQLTDILKTIPAVAIFALPGGGLALPVLIKLLPFNLLPSSFED